MKDAKENQNEMPEKISLMRVVLIIVILLSLIICLVVLRNFSTSKKSKNEDVAADYVDPEQSAKKTNLPGSYDYQKKKETSDKKPPEPPKPEPKKKIEESDNTPMDYDVKPSKLPKDPASRFRLTTHKQKPKSPYEITQGTLIPCVLDTGICSSLPSNIVAHVSAPVMDSVTGQHLLIPPGTKLFGAYEHNITFYQNRIRVVWYRLIFPNGDSLDLGEKGMGGVDLAGFAGLKDKTNYHYGKLAGAAVLSGVLSVGSRSIGDQNSTNVGEEISQEISSDINASGQKVISRQLEIPPTIEIQKGYRFNVMVDKDITLEPYNSLKVNK